MNLKIDKTLYQWIRILRNKYQIQLVPRRGKRRANYVEFIIHSKLVKYISGRQNMLPDAEKSGFWVMIRPRTGKNRYYHDHQVYQLFLTPVHPKKRNEAKHLVPAVDVSFEPIANSVRTNIRVRPVVLRHAPSPACCHIQGRVPSEFSS